MGKGFAPAPIEIRLSSNGDTDLQAPLIDQGGLGGLIEFKQSLGRVSVFSAPQAQDSRLI
jgi:hypothetical protein